MSAETINKDQLTPGVEALYDMGVAATDMDLVKYHGDHGSYGIKGEDTMLYTGSEGLPKSDASRAAPPSREYAIGVDATDKTGAKYSTERSIKVYTSPSGTKRQITSNELYPDEGVKVHRPGGAVTELTGKRAERAETILHRRAARQIGAAALQAGEARIANTMQAMEAIQSQAKDHGLDDSEKKAA